MTHIVQLDPKKVLRQFGPHPEKGKVMRIFTTTTTSAGMKVKNLVILNKAGVVVKYNGYKWVPNPIQVWPVLALRHVAGNRWVIQVKPEYLRQSLAWLNQYCK